MGARMVSREEFSHLPKWALAYYQDSKKQFDDPEEMPHRKKAFYCLLTDSSKDMCQMWKRADGFCSSDWDQASFIGTLIYSTDDTILPEKYSYLPKPDSVKKQRLRDPKQTLARKLARQLRDLRAVTPSRCAADKSRVKSLLDVDQILYRYDIALEPFNPMLTLRKFGIEHTSTSKRGWIQHRRASDTIRAQVIDTARKLAQMSDEKNSIWLVKLADELDLLPSMKNEHKHQPEMKSNKTSWGDWLRGAHHGLRNIGTSDDFLRHSDWAAIVQAIFDKTVTDEQIGQILRQKK